MSLPTIAEKLHLVMCNKDHSSECKFYEEERTGKEATHLEWLHVAKIFVANSGLSEESIEERMGNIIRLINQVNRDIDANSILKKFTDSVFRIL